MHDIIWVTGKLKRAMHKERYQHALAMAGELVNGGAKPAQARITQLAAENERLKLLVWPRLRCSNIAGVDMFESAYQGVVLDSACCISSSLTSLR